jgi:hypothetical protein
MDDLLRAHWETLIGRWYGPLSFRLVLQPVVAAFLGARAGIADARAGRAAYGWSVVARREGRLGLLGEGWADIGKLFLIALFIDLIYQLFVFRQLLPGQGLLVAASLAIPAYVVMRGLTNRALRRMLSADGTHPGGGPM